MEVDYLKGSRCEFLAFLDSISEEDSVAVLSHIDLDGLASALFIEKILDSRNIEIDYLDFLEIKPNMAKEVLVKLKDRGISKVVICDMGFDQIDFDGFREMRNEMDVFLIDHHPMNEAVSGFSKIIKTSSGDCAAMTCFFLGEGIIDYEEWNWLCCAAIFSDYSYKAEKNLKFIQSVYPEVTYENISSMVPGMNGRKINSALIYYKNDIRYVYDLVKVRNMDKIDEVHGVIEDEINRLIDEFPSRKVYFENKNIYFYEVDSRFAVLSTVTSLVSKMKPDSGFVFMQNRDGRMKFSARCQNESIDMGALMRNCTADLEGCNGGGHKPAAAAVVTPENLDVFMARLRS